jgi:hypothetical protein
MAHEIINKSEKDTHDARAEARRAEETAEREKRICIYFWFLASSFYFCGFGLINISYFSRIISASGTVRSPSRSRNEENVGHYKHG